MIEAARVHAEGLDQKYPDVARLIEGLSRKPVSFVQYFE